MLVISIVFQIFTFVGTLVFLSINQTIAVVPFLIAGVAYLALLPPSLGVSVRRLHDTGKSGWLLLLSFVPCIGAILLLVWMIEDGQAHDNAYGPVPTNTLE